MLVQCPDITRHGMHPIASVWLYALPDRGDSLRVHCVHTHLHMHVFHGWSPLPDMGCGHRAHVTYVPDLVHAYASGLVWRHMTLLVMLLLISESCTHGRGYIASVWSFSGSMHASCSAACSTHAGRSTVACAYFFTSVSFITAAPAKLTACIWRRIRTPYLPEL